jgi:hypothetical protein
MRSVKQADLHRQRGQRRGLERPVREVLVVDLGPGVQLLRLLGDEAVDLVTAGLQSGRGALVHGKRHAARLEAGLHHRRTQTVGILVEQARRIGDVARAEREWRAPSE